MHISVNIICLLYIPRFIHDCLSIYIQTYIAPALLLIKTIASDLFQVLCPTCICLILFDCLESHIHDCHYHLVVACVPHMYNVLCECVCTHIHSRMCAF